MTHALAFAAVVLICMGALLVLVWVPQVWGFWVRPQPIVMLVCDLMNSRIGWKKDGHSRLTHSTGLEFDASFANSSSRSYFELTIDHVPVSLNSGDRLRLWWAFKRFNKIHAEQESLKAALALAECSKRFAERARDYADNVVQMTKRDAA